MLYYIYNTPGIARKQFVLAKKHKEKDEKMRSGTMKNGVEWTPYRSLSRATGLKTNDCSNPFSGVCNSYVPTVPDHAHRQKVGRIIKYASLATSADTSGGLKAD